MHNFKNLKVWQKGIDLAVDTYQMTDVFPDREKYGLCSQMRRSAVSIPSNIAEGCGRNSEKDLAHFLDMAMGSANELETQQIIAERLNFVNKETSNTVLDQIHEIQKMTRTLIGRFRKTL